MNYGESLGYWYLRFNGFFLLTRFVLHRSSDMDYTSDCDLLAVRPPYVFEEVGGQPEDWDPVLAGLFSDGVTTGIVCEVKTGMYQPKALFPTKNVRYALHRLGLVSDVPSVGVSLSQKPVVDPSPNVRIAQLLISRGGKAGPNFLALKLDSVRKFVYGRIGKYKDQKYRDILFFDSTLLQNMIDEVKWESPATTNTAIRSAGKKEN
jgi:hypothetical protein